MHGLVSLLDNKYYKQVEKLWERLEEKFNLTGIKITPYPHFSWFIFNSCDFKAFEGKMEKTAKKLKHFTINTAGIGIFTGNTPVIYISVVKNEKLLEAHKVIYKDLGGGNLVSDLSPYYSPNLWVPHISIGYSDITKENIGRIMKYLSFKDFYWEMEIDNLALIYELPGTIGQLKYKFSFQES
jgi:2'-5' RNA ligase